MSLEVVHADGDGRALGRAQGAGLASQIAESITFYKRAPVASAVGWDELVAATTPYVEAARAVPAIAAELDGLAEGPGATPGELAVLNCLEEVWPFDSCVSMASGRFLLHAEMWLAGHDHIGVVIATPADGPPFVSPTCAGFLPAVGMSAGGFAQAIDSLSADDDRVGIPRVVTSRHALGGRDIDDAIARAQIEGRSGGYAHLLASVDRVAAVETSAAEARVLEGCGTHTNHYLSDISGHSPDVSRTRLVRGERLLADSPPSSLEDCAQLLSNHDGSAPICLHTDDPYGDATVFGMACDLVEGRMIVSDGRPCEGRWEEFVVPAFAEATRAR